MGGSRHDIQLLRVYHLQLSPDNRDSLRFRQVGDSWWVTVGFQVTCFIV